MASSMNHNEVHNTGQSVVQQTKRIHIFTSVDANTSCILRKKKYDACFGTRCPLFVDFEAEL